MSRNLKANAAALRRRLLDGLSLRRVGLIVLGAMICTFGIHNIHQQTGITEGGVMGLMLLIEPLLLERIFRPYIDVQRRAAWMQDEEDES